MCKLWRWQVQYLASTRFWTSEISFISKVRESLRIGHASRQWIQWYCLHRPCELRSWLPILSYWKSDRHSRANRRYFGNGKREENDSLWCKRQWGTTLRARPLKVESYQPKYFFVLFSASRNVVFCRFWLALTHKSACGGRDWIHSSPWWLFLVPIQPRCRYRKHKSSRHIFLQLYQKPQRNFSEK